MSSLLNDQDDLSCTSQVLKSTQLLVNMNTIGVCESKQIYQKLIQLQTKITDDVFQLNIAERQELWLSIVDLWVELTKKSVNVTSDDQYVFIDCLDIITTLSRQLVESKSIFGINDIHIVQKTFVACLTMLSLPHITTFLCKLDKTSDESISPFNVYLILSVAVSFAPHLLPNANCMFNERTDVLITLINYVEQRIASIELRSGSMIESILTFFWSISDRTFCIPILVKISLPESVVRWLSYANTTSYEYCVSLVSIIHNLSRHDDGVDALNKYNAIEMIKNFQRENWFITNIEILLLVPMIIAQLSSPEQLKRDKKIMNGVLNELLQRTMNAAKNDKFVDDTGFHISEFLAVMVKLFVVEERTLDYILCHAETEPSSDMSTTIRLFMSLLISFSNALNKNNQLEQFTLIAVVNIIWSISFQMQYLQELIINNKEAILLVENLVENNNLEIIDQYKPRSIEGIRVAAHGIIHNIQKYSETHTVLNNVKNTFSMKQPLKGSPNNKLSVMISYSHDNKLFCNKLVDCLSTEQDVFDIWIDRIHCQTAGDLWETIATGMEQANVIVCFISNYYFESKSCRQEFIYATDTLHKLIVPVLLENFKPKGWLGIRIPGIKYVRFQNIEQLDQEKITDLLETILATLSLSTSSVSNLSTLRYHFEHTEYYEPTASYLHTTPTPHLRLPVNQWLLASGDDIKAWFSHYHISTQLHDLYDFRTGQEMLHYGQQLIENYDKHLEIYSRAFTKKYNGDELLPHEFHRFTQAMKELLKNNKTSIVSSS